MILHEGYPVEIHTVTTEDCYILQMHRIPYGKSLSSVRFQNKPRPVVLLQHGILCSSADWVMGHSDDSLGKDDTKTHKLRSSAFVSGILIGPNKILNGEVQK